MKTRAELKEVTRSAKEETRKKWDRIASESRSKANQFFDDNEAKVTEFIDLSLDKFAGKGFTSCSFDIRIESRQVRLISFYDERFPSHQAEHMRLLRDGRPPYDIDIEAFTNAARERLYDTLKAYSKEGSLTLDIKGSGDHSIFAISWD